MNVVLISTYELGHQPFGLASPAAWLAQAGARVTCLDLAVQPLDQAAVRAAGMVAFYLPMHTATRLAAAVIRQVRALSPHALLCCYGLYAPLNAPWLRELGVAAIIGGEFEAELVQVYRSTSENREPRTENQEPRTENRGPRTKNREPRTENQEPRTENHLGVAGSRYSVLGPTVSLDRLHFLLPDRAGLPPLDQYAYVELADGAQRTAGYTEASRGCKHTCRHCPIVPVYGGRFRVVQRDVVLADIRAQVAAGAQHITFGDPDFLNGPGHARELVRALHAEFPALTYDVTIKIEHLLRYAELLPLLRGTGCLFVTSAVEAVDDAILARLDKRHTRADFVRAVGLLRACGLALNPTFVAFTPWISRQGYLDLLDIIDELDLVEHVAPIQYAIRLLIPAGSRLLELDEVRRLVGPFDQAALAYPWQHPDPAVDELQRAVQRAVQVRRPTRRAAFAAVYELALAAVGAAQPARAARAQARTRDTRPIPHMSEPWYC